SAEPFVSFLAEIQTQIDELQDDKEILSHTEKLVRTGGRLLFKGIPLLVKGGVRYFLGESGVDEVKDLFSSKNEEEIARFFGDLSQKAVDEHHKKRQSMEEFKSLLQETVLFLTSKTDFTGPLFIFIDELDRCRPTYAIELLEYIKHIFSVQGIVFILATDTEQLGHSIKSVYGEGFESNGYLKRFFDQTYNLPELSYEKFSYLLFDKLSMPSVIKDTISFNMSLINASSTTITFFDDNEITRNIFYKFAQMFRLSLREQEQCVSKIRAVLLNAKSFNVKIHFGYMCALLMAQITLPESYQQVRQNVLGLNELQLEIASYLKRSQPNDEEWLSKSIWHEAALYFQYVGKRDNIQPRIAHLRKRQDNSVRLPDPVLVQFNWGNLLLHIRWLRHSNFEKILRRNSMFNHSQSHSRYL
ncbi:MAG: hypothetical protein KAR13_14360, partial [Desulfobulbaceae bacterium]|nr:hypothetical protein [Desulfobulbaceae bacterium]